jgi:hypothetical protein
MRNPKAPAAARISAASALLDRGYGKPLQTVDANNTNVNYAVSDQPPTEEEWAEKYVTEHWEASSSHPFDRGTGVKPVGVISSPQAPPSIFCTARKKSKWLSPRTPRSLNWTPRRLLTLHSLRQLPGLPHFQLRILALAKFRNDFNKGILEMLPSGDTQKLQNAKNADKHGTS